MPLELLAGSRQERESSRAVQACNDYLRLGPGRSLSVLLDQYSETGGNLAPTRSKATLFEWSARFDWQERAVSYDTAIEAEKTELVKQRRSEALQTGLALPYERVNELKLLAHWLRRELLEIDEAGQVVGLKRDNVWLPDVKQIGGGKFAERVDIVRFNPALFERYQTLLDDLARETGGRKQKMEHTGADGGPVVVVTADDMAQARQAVEEWRRQRMNDTRRAED
jgi:hypothetical protein